MEKLRFTEQKISDRKSEIKLKILLSLFACGSIIWTFVKMTGIKIVDIGSFSGGFIYTWNKIAQIAGNNRYILMPVFEGESSGNGLFVLMSIVMLIAWNYIFIHTRKWKMLCIPHLFICVLGIFTGAGPDVNEMAICVVSLLLMIIYVKSGKKFLLSKISFISLVLALTVIFINVPAITDIASGNSKTGEIGRYARSFLEDIYYGNNLLNNGDLTQEERIAADGDALKITMEVPRSMYLRGFVGDIYTGTGWKNLSESSYYDSMNLMYWLRHHGFNALGQVGQAGEVVTEKKNQSAENYIEIEVINADRSYAYIPYEINIEYPENTKEWGGSFVTPSGTRRLNKYSYTAGTNAVSEWTEIAAKVFSEAGLKEENEGGSLNNYLIQESYYNEYVYDNFLYISESDVMLLKTFIGDEGDQSKGHIGYKTAIKRIRNFLDENFIYTDNPGPDSKTEMTALETFLTSKKGYDVHFATAAVMMFRYYGIPARYVEGYIITPDDILNADQNGTFTVPRTSIHAWPEIYIDGTGFVPIEVSPAYRGVMEEADMTVGVSNEAIYDSFENSIKNQNEEELRNTGGDENTHENDTLFAFALIILFIIIFFILLCIAIRKIIKVWNRHSIFTKADPKTAAAAIFAWMEANEYPVTQNGRDIGLCATYSNHEVTESERKEMLKILKISKKEKKDEKRKNKKNIFYLCCHNIRDIGFNRMWNGRSER